MRSWSNSFTEVKYVTQAMIWCKPFESGTQNWWAGGILISHWLTLEKWTLAYKSEVKGHSDQILWLPGDIDPRYIHAWLEVCRTTDVILCHLQVNTQTDRRTDGQTDRRTPDHRLSVKLCDLWSAKLNRNAFLTITKWVVPWVLLRSNNNVTKAVIITHDLDLLYKVAVYLLHWVIHVRKHVHNPTYFDRAT